MYFTVLSTGDPEGNQKKPCPLEIYSLESDTDIGKSGNETTMNNAKCQEEILRCWEECTRVGQKQKGPWAVEL